MKTQEKNAAKDQAKAQLESITEMVKALTVPNDEKIMAGSTEAYDEALQAIQEDALSVQVRSDWHEVGANRTDVTNGEFEILLCTGGPAVRIMGKLENAEPISAQIHYQDWGTPWTEYRLTSDEEETVLTYCRCFYFEEVA